jgi:type I restriction enzyme S subunit
MAEWTECRLGDVCNSISDTYHGESKKVVLINTSDVLDGEVLNHVLVDNIGLRGQFKKTFQKNDILYSEIRPANRRFAFVEFGNTENYIASTKLMVIRANTKKIRPRFLFAILTSNAVIQELQHLAETRSGTFPQITFSTEVAPICIRLPDFATQDKIVAILNNIERKISVNNQINDNLSA